LPAESPHPLGHDAVPDWDLEGRRSLAQLSADAGVDPVEIFVDRPIASEGRELWNLWMFGTNIEAQHRYFQMDHCIPLLGDAGAHVGQLIDADSTRFVLSELTRERGLSPSPRRSGSSPPNPRPCSAADRHPEYRNDFPPEGAGSSSRAPAMTSRSSPAPS
jgi:hypothetical protein